MPESVPTSGFSFNPGQGTRFALDGMQPLQFASGSQLAPRGQVMQWDVPKVETGAAIRLAGIQALSNGIESAGKSLAGGITMRYKNEQEIQQHKDEMAQKQAEMNQRKELAEQKMSLDGVTSPYDQKKQDLELQFKQAQIDHLNRTGGKGGGKEQEDDENKTSYSTRGQSATTPEGQNDLKNSWWPANLPKDYGKGAPLDTPDLNAPHGKSVTGKITFPAVPTTTNKLEGVLPFPLPKKTAQPMNAVEGELPTGAQIGPLPPPMLTPSQPPASSQQMAAKPESIPRTDIGTSPVSMTLSGALPPVFPAQPNPTQQTSLLDSIQPVKGSKTQQEAQTYKHPEINLFEPDKEEDAWTEAGRKYPGWEPGNVSWDNKGNGWRVTRKPISAEAQQRMELNEANAKSLAETRSTRVQNVKERSLYTAAHNFDNDIDNKKLKNSISSVSSFLTEFNESQKDKNKNIYDQAMTDDFVAFARGAGVMSGNGGAPTKEQYDQIIHNKSIAQKLVQFVTGKTEGAILTNDDRIAMKAIMTNAYNNMAERRNVAVDRIIPVLKKKAPGLMPEEMPQHFIKIRTTEDVDRESQSHEAGVKSASEAWAAAAKKGDKDAVAKAKEQYNEGMNKMQQLGDEKEVQLNPRLFSTKAVGWDPSVFVLGQDALTTSVQDQQEAEAFSKELGL